VSEFENTESMLTWAFTPASPISYAHRLQGRSELLRDLRRVWSREGASVALYGRRGVGKTSLVRVAATQFRGRVFYHSASADDTFSAIALAMFHHFGGPGGGLTPPPAPGPGFTPQTVLQFLPRTPTLLVIDDLERIECRDTRFAFADLVKKVSDARIPTTLTFVGIGDHVGELIEGHTSVARQLIVLEVPTLTKPSIEKIVRVGAKTLEIEFDREAVDEIVRLSENIPYYTHLLSECAVHCFLASIQDEGKPERVVRLRDVKAAVEYARKRGQYPVPPDDAQTWFRMKRKRTGS
jgi:hypothetical protein